MGNRVRILHVVVNMNRGGAETLLMNLYRNIDRSKVQFDFLTCKHGDFDEEIIRLGGRVFRIPYVTEAGHLGFTRHVKNFLRSRPEYKIIHSHMDKMSGLVLRAAKKAHVPIRIAHSHNTESEGGMAAKLYKWYAGSKVKKAATHFYACSEKAATWLFGNEAKNIHILNNGIEIEQFKYSSLMRETVRKELGIAKDAPVIGHIGRFSTQKNHPYLLDVFAEILKKKPEAILVLVGDGSERGRIARKVAELKIEQSVKLLGVRKDIPQLLQAFDLFVFPSIHEGLPVTLIEAQGAGLPCMISDNITREVDMEMGLIHYVSLNYKQDWIDKALSVLQLNPPREIKTQALKEKGYDIKKTAKQTQLSYELLWEGIG